MKWLDSVERKPFEVCTDRSICSNELIENALTHIFVIIASECIIIVCVSTQNVKKASISHPVPRGDRFKYRSLVIYQRFNNERFKNKHHNYLYTTRARVNL